MTAWIEDPAAPLLAELPPPEIHALRRLLSGLHLGCQLLASRLIAVQSIWASCWPSRRPRGAGIGSVRYGWLRARGTETDITIDRSCRQWIAQGWWQRWGLSPELDSWLLLLARSPHLQAIIWSSRPSGAHHEAQDIGSLGAVGHRQSTPWIECGHPRPGAAGGEDEQRCSMLRLELQPPIQVADAERPTLRGPPLADEGERRWA